MQINKQNQNLMTFGLTWIVSALKDYNVQS